MRLTAEENREALKRYAHVRPARGSVARCGRLCPGTTRGCTLEMGHRGPHVSHGTFRRILAVWDSGSGNEPVRSTSASDATPAVSASRASQPRRPIGLREGSPTGLIPSLVRMVGRALGSAEEVAFLVFFLAFVVFAVRWFLLLLG